MSNVSILIIWSCVPEDCNAYLVNVDEAEAEIIKTADGKFINLHESTPGLDALAYAMCTEYEKDGSIPPYQQFDMTEIGVDVKWYGKYSKCKLDALPDLSKTNISTIINTGYIL